MKTTRIEREPNLNKVFGESLFSFGGTILSMKDLKEYKKISVLESFDEKTKTFTSDFMYIKNVNNEFLRIVFRDKVKNVRIKKDNVFSYSIQKTQIKMIDANDILNTTIGGILTGFASGIKKTYFA